MRWVVRIVGVAVSLLVLSVGALFLIPAERIAGIAAQQFEAATGRHLRIEGSVRPSIYPVIGARVETVTLDNAPWAQGGPMLQAEAVDLGLDLLALMRGDMIVRRFEARGPRIIVERGAEGQLNWLFDVAAPARASTGDSADPARQTLSLERAEVSGAYLRYIDRGNGTDLVLEDVDLILAMPDFSGPGELSASGRYGGQSFEIEVQIGSVSRFLAGEVTALAAVLRADGVTAEFTGRGGLEPLAMDGRLALTGPGLAPLMALAGGGGEPLPPAARPVALSGQITLAPAGSLHLRDASVGLGAQRLAMALDVTFDGPRPRVTGEVNAATLDLRPYIGTDAGSADASEGPAGWSRDPIDASALGLIDAAVAFSAGPVQTGIVDLTAARGVLSIERARAVLDLREARLFDGVMSGEMVANNRSGLSVGGNLRAEGVALLPLLRQFADFERLTGTGAGELRFLGVGNSLDAIMRSLSGEGRLSLGQGEIIGFDLAGMLRNLDMSYLGEQNRTLYQSVAGTFVMNNGVLRNEDLQLASSSVSVTGRGSVDLGAQTLDYRLIPTALRNAQTGEALRVPLMITGPWTAPRFRLDLEGLTEQRLREEAARLEARARTEIQRLEAEARARVDQELEQRLGVVRREGQSAQDALREGGRQRLEEELGRGLQRLLGGGN